MVIETTIEEAEQQIEAEPVKEELENPPVKSTKSKKAKESKAKKPSAPRKRNPPAHPPYFEVVLLQFYGILVC